MKRRSFLASLSAVPILVADSNAAASQTESRNNLLAEKKALDARRRTLAAYIATVEFANKCEYERGLTLNHLDYLERLSNVLAARIGGCA